MFFRCAVRHAE